METKLIIILGLTLVTLLLMSASGEKKLFSAIPSLAVFVLCVLQYLVRWELFYLVYGIIVVAVYLKILMTYLFRPTYFKRNSFKQNGVNVKLECIEYRIKNDQEDCVLLDLYDSGKYEAIGVTHPRKDELIEKALRIFSIKHNVKFNQKKETKF